MFSKILIKTIFSASCSAFLIASFSGPTFAVEGDPLTKLISETAAKVTPDATLRGEKITDEGRLSWITEMLKNPDQLGRDIGRAGDIIVGTYWFSNPLSANNRSGKSPLLQYQMIVNELQKHVKNKNSRIKIDEQYLGTFTYAEIIYALVQTLSTSVTIQAYPAIGLIGMDTTLQPIKSERSATFNYDESSGTLMATQTTKQRMHDTEGKFKDSDLILNAAAVFNLEAGTVIFKNNFSFRNACKAWTQFSLDQDNVEPKDCPK